MVKLSFHYFSQFKQTLFEIAEVWYFKTGQSDSQNLVEIDENHHSCSLSIFNLPLFDRKQVEASMSVFSAVRYGTSFVWQSERHKRIIRKTMLMDEDSDCPSDEFSPLTSYTVNALKWSERTSSRERHINEVTRGKSPISSII